MTTDKRVLEELKNMIEGGESIVYAVEQIDVEEEGLSEELAGLLTKLVDTASDIVTQAGVDFS